MATSNFFSKSGHYFCSTSDDAEFEVETIKYDLDNLLDLSTRNVGWNRYREYIGTFEQSHILEPTSNEVIVYMDIYINFGYYEGYNLDFELNYYFGNMPHGSEEIDYIPKSLDFETKHESWLLEKAQELSNYMEKEFISIARSFGLDELERIGTFSNGETIYKKK